FLDRGKIAFAKIAHLRSDTGTISWTFEVPSHHVKGRVVDSATHEALPDVNVLDEAGHPLAGVDMFLATSDGGGLIILEHTDEAGRVTLPPRGGVVFAIPREGSLGFTSVAADQSTDVPLRVPRPAGGIDLVS